MPETTPFHEFSVTTADLSRCANSDCYMHGSMTTPRTSSGGWAVRRHLHAGRRRRHADQRQGRCIGQPLAPRPRSFHHDQATLPRAATRMALTRSRCRLSWSDWFQCADTQGLNGLPPPCGNPRGTAAAISTRTPLSAMRSRESHVGGCNGNESEPLLVQDELAESARRAMSLKRKDFPV